MISYKNDTRWYIIFVYFLIMRIKMILKKIINFYNFINSFNKNKSNFSKKNNIFHNFHSGTFRNKYVEVQNVKILVNVPTLRGVKKM